MKRVRFRPRRRTTASGGTHPPFRQGFKDGYSKGYERGLEQGRSSGLQEGLEGNGSFSKVPA